jgi:DNA transposition AAA+ family ATPase
VRKNDWPARIGKSRSSSRYREEDDKHISYVKAWSNSSSKRLFSQILKDINHAASKGNSKDLRPRLAGCLEPFGIKLLLIDNADNLQREALMDLKQLHELTKVPIVLIGERELDEVLSNFDLLTCFPNLFEFSRLDEKDFEKTLETIEVDILALPNSSNLSEGIMLELLISGSDGRIDNLIKILTKATLHSLSKGYGKIDEGVLINVINRHGRKYAPSQQQIQPNESSDS